MTRSERNSHNLVPRAKEEFYELPDPQFPIKICPGSISKESRVLLSSCSHPACILPQAVSQAGHRGEAARQQGDPLTVAEHHCEPLRDGSNAKAKVHMSRKSPVQFFKPSLTQKVTEKSICIYIKAFFFGAKLQILRGNAKAEMKEVPLSYQPSFLESPRSEI